MHALGPAGEGALSPAPADAPMDEGAPLPPAPADAPAGRAQRLLRTLLERRCPEKLVLSSVEDRLFAFAQIRQHTPHACVLPAPPDTLERAPGYGLLAYAHAWRPLVFAAPLVAAITFDSAAGHHRASPQAPILALFTHIGSPRLAAWELMVATPGGVQAMTLAQLRHTFTGDPRSRSLDQRLLVLVEDGTWLPFHQCCPLLPHTPYHGPSADDAGRRTLLLRDRAGQPLSREQSALFYLAYVDDLRGDGAAVPRRAQLYVPTNLAYPEGVQTAMLECRVQIRLAEVHAQERQAQARRVQAEVPVVAAPTPTTVDEARMAAAVRALKDGAEYAHLEPYLAPDAVQRVMHDFTESTLGGYLGALGQRLRRACQAAVGAAQRVVDVPELLEVRRTATFHGQLLYLCEFARVGERGVWVAASLLTRAHKLVGSVLQACPALAEVNARLAARVGTYAELVARTELDEHRANQSAAVARGDAVGAECMAVGTFAEYCALVARLPDHARASCETAGEHALRQLWGALVELRDDVSQGCRGAGAPGATDEAPLAAACSAPLAPVATAAAEGFGEVMRRTVQGHLHAPRGPLRELVDQANFGAHGLGTALVELALRDRQPSAVALNHLLATRVLARRGDWHAQARAHGFVPLTDVEVGRWAVDPATARLLA